MKSCTIPKWIFNKPIIAKMNNLIDITEKDNIEHGGLFCGNTKNKKINLGNICKGDRCEIDIATNSCPKGRVRLGIFHTHPHIHSESSEEPSANDLAIHFGYKHIIDCIGYPGSKEEKRRRQLICYADKPNITDKEKDLSSGSSKLRNLIEQLGMEESGLVLTTGTETTRKELEKYYIKFKPEDCMK